MPTSIRQWLLPTLGVCLVAGLCALILYKDYSRVSRQAQDEAGYIYANIYDRTRQNEVLLQSFTTLVEAQPDDFLALRRFAKAMRSRHPHIVRLQLQERILATRRIAFETLMQQRGYDYFSIRANKQRPPEIPSNTLFPYTFIEPLNSDYRHLLGLDMGDDPKFSRYVNNSIRYLNAVATPPFRLTDGRPVYILYLPAEHRHTGSTRTHVASLVISFSGLLPARAMHNEHTAISLLDANGNLLIQSGQKLSNNWLPPVTVTHQLNRFGQPLQMRLTREFTAGDIDWMLLLGLSIILLAGGKLSLTYMRQKLADERRREAEMEELETRRSALAEKSKKLNDEVRERTRELNAQMLENQRLAHRVMEVQETERRHLARELHDELGQSLTAIRTDASMLKMLYPQETTVVHQTADSIDTIARHIYSVTYDMMRYLRPNSLDDLGLVDALRECIINLRLKEQGINIETHFSGALNEMSETHNMTLYRLVQESLTNTLRHANASQIILRLSRIQKDNNDYLELTVRDNGQGFIQNNNADSGGFGVIGMRERVYALNGVFEIQSSPQGTCIEVKIPLSVTVQATGAEAGAIPSAKDEADLLH